MPKGAHIDPNTNENTGIVMIDSNQNEWVWIDVSDTVFSETTKLDPSSDNIEADLYSYYKDSDKMQKKKWFDKYGATYDGYSDFTELTLNYSRRSWFTIYKNYYGTIYKDNTGAEIADNYEDGITYYAKVTEDFLNRTDGCGLTYTDYYNLYNNMLSSIYNNKGFYVARYEAGIAGSDTDTSKARYSHTSISDTSPLAVSKQNMIPYNFISCEDAQKLASKMATEGKSSSILFPIQALIVKKFIGVDSITINTFGNFKDSNLKLSRGKYNINPNSSKSVWETFNIDTENYVINSQTSNDANYSQLLTTGASDDTNIMNIYDFYR